MTSPRAERRLASILVADVVGYSRLVETDEAGTLAAVKALRTDVLEPLLGEHRGRVVKLMGDGIIAEFGSIVDAVACAAALQAQITRNRSKFRRTGGSASGSASTSVMSSSKATTCWATASTLRLAWSSCARPEAS